MKRGERPGFAPPLTIVSDGTASGTFVRDNRTGHRVPGVTRIDFDPIEAGAGFVTAKLTVISGLDVAAESGRQGVEHRLSMICSPCSRETFIND